MTVVDELWHYFIGRHPEAQAIPADVTALLKKHCMLTAFLLVGMVEQNSDVWRRLVAERDAFAESCSASVTDELLKGSPQ